MADNLPAEFDVVVVGTGTGCAAGPGRAGANGRCPGCGGARGRPPAGLGAASGSEGRRFLGCFSLRRVAQYLINREGASRCGWDLSEAAPAPLQRVLMGTCSASPKRTTTLWRQLKYYIKTLHQNTF